MSILSEKYKKLANKYPLESALQEIYPQWERQNASWTPQAIVTISNTSEGHLWLVRDSDVRLVGFVLYKQTLDEAELLYLHVDLVHRKSGIGFGLMNQSLAELTKAQIRKVFLEVRPSNTPAISLYAKCGFSNAGRRSHYYQDGEDALIMRKDIITAVF